VREIKSEQLQQKRKKIFDQSKGTEYTFACGELAAKKRPK
jgi:hypothetical protein